MNKTLLEGNAERKRVNRATCRPSSRTHPRWLSRRYSRRVARRPAGSVTALVCWRRVSRRPSKSTLVASTTATRSPPLTDPLHSERHFYPFGVKLRHAPCIANSILLPHSCAEDDQVHPSVFPEGIRGKETATGAIKSAGITGLPTGNWRREPHVQRQGKSFSASRFKSHTSNREV